MIMTHLLKFRYDDRDFLEIGLPEFEENEIAAPRYS